MTARPKSPEAIRKAEERKRRREAGEFHLQRWIPGAARAEIEAAIDGILERHAATIESRDP
jgi:hypothetical protein